jgi:nucleotidyltransferase/DNA polymerase involved in DNA repair
VQTLTDTACAIAASYAAKAFGIKTGTLVRDARRLCPAIVPVQANHRLYTDYHDRILKAVDTCRPIEKVMSIDEMACRLMGTERQVPTVLSALAPGGGYQSSWGTLLLVLGGMKRDAVPGMSIHGHQASV